MSAADNKYAFRINSWSQRKKLVYLDLRLYFFFKILQFLVCISSWGYLNKLY